MRQATGRQAAPGDFVLRLTASHWATRVWQRGRHGTAKRRVTVATPPRNLVFLIEFSGSMPSADKLPLVRNALRLLADTLTSHDRVAIVVYAGNGGEGIQLAYRVARQHCTRGGVNRVILATDGDFNVGVTSQDALARLIEQERASGVFLSVLGVGTGNLQDSAMEAPADTWRGPLGDGAV